MSGTKIIEKTVKLHYGDSPLKSGWYYCIVVFQTGNTDDDLVYYDSAYDEWQHRGNEAGIICWMEPLDELLREKTE